MFGYVNKNNRLKSVVGVVLLEVVINMEIKSNEIYLGDCLELMRYIPDKSVDMILCDLPYG